MEQIFKIVVDELDNSTGLAAVALVEWPAVEYNFLKFSKEKSKLKFEDEKRIISGVAILADTPIYREDEFGNPYYIIFEKETVRKLVEKYSTEKLNNSVNIEHCESKFVDNVTMIESYIVDKERGICPVEFSEVPDGSWIVSYKVNNPTVWEKIKSGEVKGFSVEGIFELAEKLSKKNIKKNKMSKLKEALKSLLMKYNDLMTDKGELEWEEDTQLEVGYKVYIDGAPAPDGEYTTSDKVFVVADGEVKEIKDVLVGDEEMKRKEKCAEEEPANEEPTETETPAEPENKEDNTAELEKRITDLENKLAEIEAKLIEVLSTPAVEPVVEEFNSAIRKNEITDIKLKRAIDIVSSMNK